LFENLVYEGICGRFGSFRWIGRLHIGLLASAMIEMSASLFCGSCSLWGLEHKTEEMNGQA
ncbi:hypothetical protein, partial [Pararhodobacter marinus]|uniref:hypothetical protein n=1 Tax=Pararhodobacter marinus TaxID=2184063 RepID=UPI001AF01F52